MWEWGESLGQKGRGGRTTIALLQRSNSTGSKSPWLECYRRAWNGNSWGSQHERHIVLLLFLPVLHISFHPSIASIGSSDLLWQLNERVFGWLGKVWWSIVMWLELIAEVGVGRYSSWFTVVFFRSQYWDANMNEWLAVCFPRLSLKTTTSSYLRHGFLHRETMCSFYSFAMHSYNSVLSQAVDATDWFWTVFTLWSFRALLGWCYTELVTQSLSRRAWAIIVPRSSSSNSSH